MAWPTPADLLTLLRIGLVVPLIWLIAGVSGRPSWPAAVVWVVAAGSDYADGWLARRQAGGSRWGALADPFADKLLILATLGALVFFLRVSWWAWVIIAMREVGVSAQRWWLLRRGIVLPAQRSGKAKTASQLLAVLAYLTPLAALSGGPAFALLLLAVVLTVVSGAHYAWLGWRFARAS